MGKSYEQKGRWNDAIELYMNSNETDITLMERAIEVSRTHVPNRTGLLMIVMYFCMSFLLYCIEILFIYLFN